MLVFLSSALTGTFNYNRLENQIVAQLYKKPKLDGKLKESKTLDAEDQSPSHELYHSARIGDKKFCGSGDRVDRWFNLGRRTLKRDTSIIRLVRSLRLIEGFVEGCVSAKEHKKMLV